MPSSLGGREDSLGRYWDVAERANEAMADGAATSGAGPSQLLSILPPTCEDDLLAAVRPFLAISQLPGAVPAQISEPPQLQEDVPNQAGGPGEIVQEPDRAGAPTIERGDASTLQLHMLETNDTRPSSTGFELDQEQVDAVVNRAELAADEVRAGAGSASPTKSPMQHELVSQEDVNVVAPLRLRVKSGQAAPTGIEHATATESSPRIYQGRRSFQLSQSYLPSPVNEPARSTTTANGRESSQAQHDPSSSAPHELDADAYVITNYYPSDESQSVSEHENPTQVDYPLKHRPSQRRRGSLERPVAPSAVEERPWRHSDSMTRREPRPVQPDGMFVTPAEARSSWYRANSPTTSPAVARAHRLSLPPTASRGPSDGERSVSSGHGTMTGSSSTRSERALDPVDGHAPHPLSQSPVSSLLASDRQRPSSYHDAQFAEPDAPAWGSRPHGRPFGSRVSSGRPSAENSTDGPKTFLSQAPAESSTGPPAQAPPLPRRDSRRTRRDGGERDYYSVPQAHRPRRSSRSHSDEQRAAMSTRSHPSSSSLVATRNGLSLEETNLYQPRPPSRRPDPPTRPAPVPAQMAHPRRRQFSDDSRHPPFRPHHPPGSEPTMSGGLSRERVPSHLVGNVPVGGSMPRYGRRDLVSPARSYEHTRPRAFPSIHEEQVYADGPARPDLAYSPDGHVQHSYSSASQSQSQHTWSHSRRTSVQRNPSSQWTGISSAAHWSERSTSSTPSHVRMKTTTIPAALYQQALALKELPPPPPPSKTPAETHPLLEQGLAPSLGKPYSAAVV